MSRARLVVLGGLLALSGLACRSGRTYEESGGDVAIANDKVLVEVVNDNFSDVNIYAAVSGVATRLGTVTGNSKSRFTLDRSYYPTGEVRLVGDAIGGSGRASTGRLLVSAGQTVVFHIAPVLSQSSASVR